MNSAMRIFDCKERNRDHARKTRLRKKLAIDCMRNRIAALQTEAARLQALCEENDTAAILMGLSSQDDPSNGSDLEFDKAAFLMKSGQKIMFLESDPNKMLNELRIAVRMEAAGHRRQEMLDARRTGVPKTISSGATSTDGSSDSTQAAADSKDDDATDQTERDSGDCDHEMDSDSDDDDIDGEGENDREYDDDHDGGSQGETDCSSGAGDGAPAATKKVPGNSGTTSKPLFSSPTAQLAAPAGRQKTTEDMRRERNKMHARLTRDRKKIFTRRLAELTRCIEDHNARLRKKLNLPEPATSTPANADPLAVANAQSKAIAASLVGPTVKKEKVVGRPVAQKEELQQKRQAQLQHQMNTLQMRENALYSMLQHNASMLYPAFDDGSAPAENSKHMAAYNIAKGSGQGHPLSMNLGMKMNLSMNMDIHGPESNRSQRAGLMVSGSNFALAPGNAPFLYPPFDASAGPFEDGFRGFLPPPFPAACGTSNGSAAGSGCIDPRMHLPFDPAMHGYMPALSASMASLQGLQALGPFPALVPGPALYLPPWDTSARFYSPFSQSQGQSNGASILHGDGAHMRGINGGPASVTANRPVTALQQ